MLGLGFLVTNLVSDFLIRCRLGGLRRYRTVIECDEPPYIYARRA